MQNSSRASQLNKDYEKISSACYWPGGFDMMMFKMADFIRYFSIIPDYRVDRCKKYPLIEILFLCMAAVIADTGGREEIEDFGFDHVTLGQVKVDDKTNEITMISEILNLPAIKAA